MYCEEYGKKNSPNNKNKNVHIINITLGHKISVQRKIIPHICRHMSLLNLGSQLSKSDLTNKVKKKNHCPLFSILLYT